MFDLNVGDAVIVRTVNASGRPTDSGRRGTVIERRAVGKTRHEAVVTIDASDSVAGLRFTYRRAYGQWWAAGSRTSSPRVVLEAVR